MAHGALWEAAHVEGARPTSSTRRRPCCRGSVPGRRECLAAAAALCWRLLRATRFFVLLFFLPSLGSASAGSTGAGRPFAMFCLRVVECADIFLHARGVSVGFFLNIWVVFYYNIYILIFIYYIFLIII